MNYSKTIKKYPGSGILFFSIPLAVLSACDGDNTGDSRIMYESWL